MGNLYTVAVFVTAVEAESPEDAASTAVWSNIIGAEALEVRVYESCEHPAPAQLIKTVEIDIRETRREETPATRRERLLEDVEGAHDWMEGQVWGGTGTQLSSNSRCQICGLTRRWFSDSQNGIEGEYSFTDTAGESLTLGEAAIKRCC